MQENTFGICIHEGSTSNGTLTLGGINSDLATGPFIDVDNTGFPLYVSSASQLTAGSHPSSRNTTRTSNYSSLSLFCFLLILFCLCRLQQCDV